MKKREEALKYGLSFKNVYEEKPFHDQNLAVSKSQRK